MMEFSMELGIHFCKSTTDTHMRSLGGGESIFHREQWSAILLIFTERVCVFVFVFWE
jgi:hypothetical protein